MKKDQGYHDVAELALLFVVAVVFIVALIAAIANAKPARPCGMGGSNKVNRQLAKCLARQPGIQVDRAKAVSVGNCESRFYAKAHGHPYHGIYQLGTAEFDSFQHQGPKWVDKEFREYDYGIHSARGNILAAFAHAHDHGWGAWSCA